MRSKYRSAVGVLVAALALGVGVTASASAALPEFSPGAGSFTVNGGLSYFEQEVFTQVPVCNSLAGKGKITGAKSGTLEVEMSACHTNGGSVGCGTAGKTGIVDFSATIEPVYLSKEPKNVGLLVKVTEFSMKCGITTVTVRGSFLGSITPINKGVPAGGHFTLAAKEESGVNEYTTYETASGEKKSAGLSEMIQGGPFLGAAFSSTDSLVPSIATEIKA